MKDWQVYEIIAAVCTFVFIGTAACWLITLLHLQITYSMVWAVLAISSGFCAQHYYGKYEESKD